MPDAKRNQAGNPGRRPARSAQREDGGVRDSSVLNTPSHTLQGTLPASAWYRTQITRGQPQIIQRHDRDPPPPPPPPPPEQLALILNSEEGGELWNAVAGRCSLGDASRR
ncbi:hypothetical protein F2P81_012124 [Scophthalmus maximus]|uniref:Uncharacterized protein n=1 Tax=Scophthalmus maximus TaxID=52904 RepID=A0A6A4T3R7_SCOMX|nr:hypothetical protein F2P81_012124 [Scophthalmus maximus]